MENENKFIQSFDEEKPAERKKSAAKKIGASQSEAKEYSITAKVSAKTLNTFNAIADAYGMSKNSVLNMLIAQYIKQNEFMIEKED